MSDNSSGDVHSFTLEVSNKMGVHARPAAMIVRVASEFSGEVWVTKKDGDRVNAKSIMGIMMLAAARGSELTFECSHSEASELEKQMSDLFASKFQDENLPYFTKPGFILVLMPRISDPRKSFGSTPLLQKVVAWILHPRFFLHHPEKTYGQKISFQKPLRQALNESKPKPIKREENGVPRNFSAYCNRIPWH